MRRRLSLFVATLVMVVAAALTFTSTGGASVMSDALDSCRTQCRVAYQKCVKETSNPGGLNQCRRAYEECLSGCQ